MNEGQIRMVKESWAKVAPIASTAAVLFYGRLFEVAPGVRALFPDDMADQKRKLMTTIGRIVSRLDGLDALDPQIHALAVRHVSYGAAPAHYDAVGDCLLWTLDKGLGDDFTPELREAWTAAYALLSTRMIAAAEAHGVAYGWPPAPPTTRTTPEAGDHPHADSGRGAVVDPAGRDD
jgi:hemoglobin-like flavoprotein